MKKTRIRLLGYNTEPAIYLEGNDWNGEIFGLLLSERHDRDTMMQQVRDTMPLSYAKRMLSRSTANLWFSTISNDVLNRISHGDQNRYHTGQKLSRGILNQIVWLGWDCPEEEAFKRWFAATNEKPPWRRRLAMPIRKARTWDEILAAFEGGSFYDALIKEFIEAMLERIREEQA